MAETQHTGNPGNFAEDRERAVRAGHVGGQHSSGNFANNRERAAAAGRKGGQASHRKPRSKIDTGSQDAGSAASGTKPADEVKYHENGYETGHKVGHLW